MSGVGAAGRRADRVGKLLPGSRGVAGCRESLGPGEARAGAASAALVSDRLWRTRFAADPELLGKTITVNGHPFAVIGILPPGFEGTFIGFRFDLWLPLARAAETAPGLDLEDRGDDSLELIGRLGAGVSRREAQAELGALATRLARDHPNENRGMGVDVRKATPVDDSLRGVITTLLTLLTSVSGLVLLVACVNVSGLLQARNLARSREFAVRRAIGAGRGDLARLSLAETLPLFAAGSAAGFLASSGSAGSSQPSRRDSDFRSTSICGLTSVRSASRRPPPDSARSSSSSCRLSRARRKRSRPSCGREAAPLARSGHAGSS